MALGFEIRSWRKGIRLATRSQKGYRIVAAVVLEAALVMIFFAKTIATRDDPVLELSYWSIVLMLLFVLVAVALLDVRATLVTYRHHRREMLDNLLGEERREQ